MIGEEAFVEAMPRAVAPLLDDAIHLWRLPWRRDQERAPLLALLAAYLDVDARALALDENAHGKPHLSNAQGLRFNWSHSGTFALIALNRDFEIGVDIEQPRTKLRALELARRFFATAEADALAAIDGSERESAFLELWCAKEAVLKALGRGLAFGLERVEFIRTNRVWQPSRFAVDAGAAPEWRVLPIVAPPNYAGALAWRGPARTVRAWKPLADAG